MHAWRSLALVAHPCHARSPSVRRPRRTDAAAGSCSTARSPSARGSVATSRTTPGAWAARSSLPVGRKRLELRPSGDLFFPKDGDTGWQVNGDAAIHLGQGGGLYAGGGVAFCHPGGGETKTGYNLFFGLSTAAADAAAQALRRVSLDVRQRHQPVSPGARLQLPAGRLDRV